MELGLLQARNGLYLGQRTSFTDGADIGLVRQRRKSTYPMVSSERGVVLDGVNDFVDFTGTGHTQPSASSTYEFLFNLTPTVNQVNYLVGSVGVAASNFSIGSPLDEKLQSITYAPGSSTLNCSVTKNFLYAYGQLTHVVIVHYSIYDGILQRGNGTQSADFYVNGKWVGWGTCSNTADSLGVSFGYFGKRFTADTFFPGKIYFARAYDGYLMTPKDVVYQYNDGKFMPPLEIRNNQSTIAKHFYADFGTLTELAIPTRTFALQGGATIEGIPY